ncbi:ISAs1 family transposase [Kineosporia babensis]|uniref:ISAs1 family transposase n=1 Tax=Kineosporia babensis TaxID=499548 RepID=A0A9X1NQ77_9ACTN|nr:ISAs1 family transposase [Kineosporia babensis]
MPASALLRAGGLVVESLDADTGRVVQELPQDVWGRLEGIRDPRSTFGRTYALASLVAIALCALTAAGHEGMTAIGQWIARAGSDELARFRLPFDVLTGCHRVPSEKTIRGLLDRIEPADLTRAVLTTARPGPARVGGPAGTRGRSYPARQARRQADALRNAVRPWMRPIAVDGKTSRGARRSDGHRVHLLGVCEHASAGGRFLGHVEIDAKSSEVTHFQDTLRTILDGDLAGRVVTFDALLTVRAHLQWLHEDQKAFYIAIVKKNQPTTYRACKRLPWKHVRPGETTHDHGHGRDETRALKCVQADTLGLPGAVQALRITRWRQNTRTQKISRETVYAVTNLTSAQAAPEDLARLARGHWGIEVHHHVRDVTFREDHSASRTGHGPANLATLRAAVINTVKDAGYLYITDGRRDHTRPDETLNLHGFP